MHHFGPWQASKVVSYKLALKLNGQFATSPDSSSRWAQERALESKAKAWGVPRYTFLGRQGGEV